MILEGLVTSLDGQLRMNVAAMGAITGQAPNQIVLRPFASSVTYQNLHVRPEGVFHITDDVLLLAKAAIDQLQPLPTSFPAETVCGRVLEETCLYHEFRVVDHGPPSERATLICQINVSKRLRDFFGFNRAKHAVLELAIVASRVHLLPSETVQSAMAFLEPLVDKTGGRQEGLAWRMLKQYIQDKRRQSHDCESEASPRPEMGRPDLS